MKTRRTDNLTLSRDMLSKRVFAVDGLGATPESLTDLINAIMTGSASDVEREITTLAIQSSVEVVSQ